MLQKETVTAATLEILNELMQDEALNDFFLVGGTALALQIGHRISIDLDLFSLLPFDENKTLSYLEKDRRFRLDYQDRNTLKGQIDKTKVDLITHNYPLVRQLILSEGIRLASLDDIAAMKIKAVVTNGTRLKDFIDIAFLSAHLKFDTMLEAYERKYATRNPLATLKSLSYFDDINFSEPVQMLNGNYNWSLLKKRLKEMTEFPSLIFDSYPI